MDIFQRVEIFGPAANRIIFSADVSALVVKNLSQMPQKCLFPFDVKCLLFRHCGHTSHEALSSSSIVVILRLSELKHRRQSDPVRVSAVVKSVPPDKA